MIIIGPIDSFFKKPSEEPSPGGDCILYHLRRDLEELYGDESDYKGKTSLVMLAIMGMLAGIDYLSKVYSSSAQSGDRFIETVKDLCKINNDDSEAMYQFRCALVHSVGLSGISNRIYRKGTRFNFEVTDEPSAPLIQKLTDASTEVTYRISYWELKKIFLKVTGEIENIAMQVNHHKNSHVINMIGLMHSEKILKK